MKLPSVWRAPHPQDTDGLNTLELNSLGRYPEEAPLLFIIHRDRVKGRIVAELGVHSVGVESGRARVVEVVIVEIRTAVPTARESDFNIMMMCI